MEIQSPFLWGSNGQKLTPEQVARQRAQADAMLEGVGDTSPVQHWLQGAGRVVNAITGKIKERRADSSEALGMKSADDYIAGNSVLSGLIGGGTSSGDPSVSAGGFGGGATGAPADGGTIRQMLIDRGLPEHVADGFVMNFQDESGLNPDINEANPTVAGSRGGYGLYQLTGPRRVAYENYAASRGVAPSDVGAQLDFMMSELQGPESAAAKAIFNTTDAGQAGAAIVNKFLRPAAEHAASRTARYTGGGGWDASGAPKPITGGGSNVVAALAGAMSDPWVVKKYGPVIQSLMGQEMGRSDMQYQQQLKQSDPAYQQEREMNAIKLDQMRNPVADPWAGTEIINGQVVRMGANGPESIGDFNTPESGYQMVTPEEAAGMGLPAGAYQRAADGKVSAIGGGGTNVTVNNNPDGSPVDEDLRKKLMEAEGTQWANHLSAGSTAAGMNQDMAILDQVIELAPTGPIQGRLAEQFPGVSDAAGVFQSVVKRIAPSLRVEGSGSQSDIEYQGFLQSLPSLANRPEANRAISAVLKAKAQINMERAAAVSAYQNGTADATKTRQKLTEINSRSILSPEIQSTLGAIDPNGAAPTEQIPEGIDPMDWKYMSPEEKAVFQ